MSGKHVIDQVKLNCGYASDNALAMDLDIDRRVISNIKRNGGDPSGKLLIKLMKKGNLEIEETEILLGAKGFISMSLIIATALWALPFVYLLHMLKDCILC